MIRRINVFLFSLLIAISSVFVSSTIYAGAAEKWEYDVIPDQSQTLKVKGHKVDQYGAAVNDYEYNTKIDPKTAANRTKMGNVGMGRLLKMSGWGLLGSAALQALLEAVDWVIDPATQSIWRNKPSNTGSPNMGCSITRMTGGKRYSVIFTDYNGKEFNCAYDAAISILRAKIIEGGNYYKPGSEVFVRWVNSDFTQQRVSFDGYMIIQAPGKEGLKAETRESVGTKDVPIKDPASEKEVLTPEALADYANHTHPDYSNPALAPKLDPKYKPEIQTDLWKPSNPWEDANSPTVQEVKKKLDEASPEPKTDPELTPNPDTGGFSLPEFCSWAAPVCEFFKWIKEPPETQDSETNVDIEPSVEPEINNNYLQWNAYCPFTAKSDDISINGQTSALSSDLTSWCTMASEIKPFVLLAGALASLMIVSGVGLGRGDD